MKGQRSTRYVPSAVPQQSLDLSRFLQLEFERVNDGVESPIMAQVLEALSAEPARKLAGKSMVVYADGTNWNPGSGAGIYAYYGGSWKFLG